MAYEKRNWENSPSTNTPITAESLKHMEDGIFNANEEAAKKMNAENPTGTGSFSMNRKADTTVGACSHAEGNEAEASGEYAHAEGSNTKAQGARSHAEGAYTIASGANSHVEGSNYTTASGISSHAEGSATEASGQASHAEGSNTKAQGENSHAEGLNAKASREYAHAEGAYTVANGKSSHAEGWGTTVSGPYAHAEGLNAKASGQASHAEGEGTISIGKIQHVQGKYNEEDAAGIYAHIVGGGASATDRKNIHTLDWQGNAFFAGDVKSGEGFSLNELSKKIEVMGGGGASYYAELLNKPRINGVELDGNKTLEELGIQHAESGKGLSTNDYTTEEKRKLAEIPSGAAANQNAFSNVKVINWENTATIQADSVTDTLTLKAGNNITLTPNVTGDEIVIAAEKTAVAKNFATEDWDMAAAAPLIKQLYEENQELKEKIKNIGKVSLKGKNGRGSIELSSNEGTIAMIYVARYGSTGEILDINIFMAYKTYRGWNISDIFTNGGVTCSFDGDAIKIDFNSMSLYGDIKILELG